MDDTGTRMGKGQNEGGFSEEQVQMYKDCFKLMDINKDGQLDKNDLRGAFDNVGVLMSESELDGLLGEISPSRPSSSDSLMSTPTLSKAPRRSFLSSWPSLLMSISLKQSLYICTCSSENPPSF